MLVLYIEAGQGRQRGNAYPLHTGQGREGNVMPWQAQRG